ncbi:MAG: hypothetical protein CM15mP98_06410 [Paracoccaceae bacterium]|nr:MAG: hypothetical protein CM15mP98_06410 [Paracoccaceae bacterium]
MCVEIKGSLDPDFDSIEEFSKHCFVPFTVGGVFVTLANSGASASGG